MPAKKNNAAAAATAAAAAAKRKRDESGSDASDVLSLDDASVGAGSDDDAAPPAKRARADSADAGESAAVTLRKTLLPDPDSREAKLVTNELYEWICSQPNGRETLLAGRVYMPHMTIEMGPVKDGGRPWFDVVTAPGSKTSVEFPYIGPAVFADLMPFGDHTDEFCKNVKPGQNKDKEGLPKAKNGVTLSYAPENLPKPGSQFDLDNPGVLANLERQ
jgi:hypothetical protein